MPQLEGNDHHAGNGRKEPGAHNKLLDDSLNLVQEHKTEVAVASAALAVGSIALLRGKALLAAGKELGAVAKAAEEGISTFKPVSFNRSPLRDSPSTEEILRHLKNTIIDNHYRLTRGAPHTFRPGSLSPEVERGIQELLSNTPPKPAVPLSFGMRGAPHEMRQVPLSPEAEEAFQKLVSSIGRSNHSASPVVTAARETFDASVPKNVESAADIFAGLTREGYRHVPYRIPAANIRMQQGASLMPDAVPNSFTREADRVIHGLSPKPDVFSTFDQSAYRHVPFRDMASRIRLQEGITMRPTDGPSRIVFAEDNSVQHILFNKSATVAEKAEDLMTASYANLINSDVLAAKAAGKFTGRSIGFFPQPIERIATPKQMQENAVNGARAYLRMDESGANGFTKYLTELYGPMTKESQDLGRHIMTNPRSVESGWTALSRPATEILREAGLSINPLNRALASHPNIMQSSTLDRAATIRGGAQYLESKLSAEMPEGLEGIARHAWFDRHAAALKPEVVHTISSVTKVFGKEASLDFKTIDKVAEMVGPNGHVPDYVAAFQALKQGKTVVANLINQAKNLGA